MRLAILVKLGYIIVVAAAWAAILLTPLSKDPWPPATVGVWFLGMVLTTLASIPWVGVVSGIVWDLEQHDAETHRLTIRPERERP